MPHFTLAQPQTNLKHRANQQAYRPQYSRPSCACLNQAIRMALQEPGRLGLLVGEKSELARVPSCPVHAGAAHVVDQETYPSLPPSVPPLCRRAIGTNATQRSATQRDPTTPAQPSPAQPVLSQSEARKARAATRSASSLVSVLLESRQVGASLEIQRSSSRQTQDRSRPGRQTTSSQYTVPARQTTSVSATHPGLASSEPACLPVCLPAHTLLDLLLSTPEQGPSPHLVLSCPALP